MEIVSKYLRQRHRIRNLPESQRQTSFVARDTAIMRRHVSLGPDAAAAGRRAAGAARRCSTATWSATAGTVAMPTTDHARRTA